MIFPCKSLDEILNEVPGYSGDFSFGKDIDDAHKEILDPYRSEFDKIQSLLKWLAKFQPCLFGRLGSKRLKGVNFDICWISSEDIKQGDLHVMGKIQVARRRWKDSASKGESSGFLIMFNDRRFADAKPGKGLLLACKRAAELYLVENFSLQFDTIYTEAIPLEIEGRMTVFKGGVNVFYPGGHRTLNHDRRVPGGLLISVNSPGHLANSLLLKGVFPSLAESVQWVYDIAMKSVGNGGIGVSNKRSNSWHNTVDDPEKLKSRCPVNNRPHYVPENYSGRTYSATYHTDVLLPSDVTVDDRLDLDFSGVEIWKWLVIDYISEMEFSPDHINYGLFHGHEILPEAIYHNPWPPRLAKNSPLFEY